MSVLQILLCLFWHASILVPSASQLAAPEERQKVLVSERGSENVWISADVIIVGGVRPTVDRDELIMLQSQELDAQRIPCCSGGVPPSNAPSREKANNSAHEPGKDVVESNVGEHERCSVSWAVFLGVIGAAVVVSASVWWLLVLVLFGGRVP